MSKRIVLVGHLGTAGATELVEHCALLRAQSDTEIVVDMTAVRTCDTAGLEALLALHFGERGARLVVDGARWSQFFDLLIEAPLDELGQLCHLIRQVMWSPRRGRQAAAGSPAAATAPAVSEAVA